jgi:hypothetical protein
LQQRVPPGISPYELSQDLTFGLKPIGQGGAGTASSRAPKCERAPLDLLLGFEVFLHRKNHPFDNQVWR